MIDWVNKKLGEPTWIVEPPCFDSSAPEPKRPRGAPKKIARAIEMAARDVVRIRRLWEAEYGRKNRHSDDGPSAEWIASKRWKVNEEAVRRRLKHPL
jgi:hypothetical protein